jgi:hypothetical protein
VTGEQNLRHVLKSYMEYYNAVRTHLSLGKDRHRHLYLYATFNVIIAVDPDTPLRQFNQAHDYGKLAN